MKITIIGGGVMGQAIAKAVLEQQVLKSDDLTITDIDLAKLQSLENLGVKLLENNLEAIKDADVVLVAVKPQVMNKVLAPLSNKIESKALVISIMAGVTIKTIQTILNHQEIVRVMPNTPLLIGEGMSGWFADVTVSSEQKKQVKNILSACGKEIEVKTENEIDIITALSGSGPAYVFLFLQSLIEGAKRLGLNEVKAKEVAIQTLLGGVKLAESSEDDLQVLIEKVTSKGGTTEAALKRFAELGFKENVGEAMQMAYNRAKELGGN